ncbi:protein phosphatase pp1 regulatory subunit [Diplodia corticola]|uniref:Protein phosphatase pp1 regulatory subunit n=1 Tax=Diplodia corticola TaxID=236234 RepID=A0A1J9RUD1_9PEZI|nr:protein phosphatase pp1 regulatory subunit [Diplodia corticola]OJD36187.1 protein phosphatase pp1 regulatory subunit [Diplodia corticola]
MTDDTPPNAAHDAPHAMVIDNNSERDDAHDQPSSPARSSKSGWDGKLRVTKPSKPSPVVVNPNVFSDPELSDDDAPPPDTIEADEDLLEDYEEDVDQIDLIHCRITSIAALRLERFPRVERLSLRQNQISAIDQFPEQLGRTVTELDLYDNLIAHIKGLEAFVEVENLDLSFNKIKHIKRVNHMKKLKDLYFVQNKISAIENLEGLAQLRNLELGANRIRTIENLETLTSLEELWLGKNKITEIKGLDTLSNLKILSIQSNRLTSITGLEQLANLEELHISHNALTSTEGVENNKNLRIIDITGNPIEHLTNLAGLTLLEEFWASYCQLADFAEIERELRDKENLETVYFEGNPLQTRQPALYRNKVRLALPQVKQIDASKYSDVFWRREATGTRSLAFM